MLCCTHQTHVKLVSWFTLTDVKCEKLSGLKMLFLLSCWIIAGIAAEDVARRHYRAKNSSVCFQVGKPPSYGDIQLEFNKVFIVYNKKVSPKYSDKVDFNQSDSSLCIKKLNETDSGIYTVTFINSDFGVSKKTHRLIVEENVPTPIIRMSVIRSNHTAGFCNITVNCSVQNDWAWSVCDADRCKTSQTSLSKVNITVSAHNRSVVCSGSNHVSTSNVSESMEATCFNKSEHKKRPVTFIVVTKIIIIVVTTAVCVTICIFIVCVAKRHRSRERNNHQTSPVQLRQSHAVEAQPQRAPRASTSSSSEADAAYENVDAMQPSQTSSPREELGQTVDTVYSFLQATNAKASAGNGDSSKSEKGHMQIHEASNSHSVTPDQAEQPAQIDTVYSVLQKTKN